MSKTLETKKKILNLLKKRGMTISGLSEELGLSTATISQHIDELQSMGAIEKIDNEHFKKLKYYKATQETSPMVLKYVLGIIAIIALVSIVLLGTMHTVSLPPANSYVSNPTSINQTNTSSALGITGQPTGAMACPMLFYTITGSITGYNGISYYTINATNGQQYADYVIKNGSSANISVTEGISDVLSEPANFNETRQHYMTLLQDGNAINSSAPGINFTISPSNFIISSNSDINSTITLNTAQNATGSYWATIDGPCGGGIGPFLITVGNSPDYGTTGPPFVIYS